MAFNGGSSKKTYDKWYIRPQDPAKNWGFTDEAAKYVQGKMSKKGFQDNRNDDNKILNMLKSPAKYSFADQSNVNQFLNEVLVTKARFPDSAEAKEIFEDLDNMVAMMCLSLRGKSAFFQGCTAKRVGSTAEKLKTGKPDEFDYNIILPNVAGNIAFMQDFFTLSGEIHATFFPNLSNYDEYAGSSDIYFEITDLKILEGIVSQDELDALYSRKLDEHYRHLAGRKLYSQRLAEHCGNIRSKFPEKVQEGKVIQ